MRSVILPARCDRAATQALLPEFQASLGAGALSIDASQTTQIGQSMLQLLISARRTGEGASITPSAELLRVARLTGLEAVLFEGNIA
jgi:anti-anti-sigma regulatory factor